MSIAADAFIDGLKRGESINDVATKFFEKGQLIRERIKQEEKLWEEARAKLQAEADESCRKALEDQKMLTEQLMDCKASTLESIYAKAISVDFDTFWAVDGDDVSLVKSTVEDIRALRA